MDGDLEDTICAIATPAGEGGIGIVRISGPRTLSIAEKIVRLRSGLLLKTVSSHTLHLADILAPEQPAHSDTPAASLNRPDRDFIDEALVVFMKGPRSFTAEDVVEIHCHAGTVVLRLVCEACLTAGARLAEPGEFTQRAFLNGRLDLSQAEAVLDTIRAKSEAGLKIAQRHLRGELGQHVELLRARFVRLLAQVEAGIDFAEEDIAFIEQEELRSALEETSHAIRTMLETSARGVRLREGARVVITGRPNVGKSSLLNTLLGIDRAIVTDIPGTTRDVIEESVVWDGLMITLVDTAGLRDTADVVEQEGIKRTHSAVKLGDLVLHVLDATELQEQDLSPMLLLPGSHMSLVVINKSDLVDTDRLMRLSRLAEDGAGCRVLVTSVRTGVGLDGLREAIRSYLLPASLESTGSMTITNVRHRQALERADTSIREALDSVRNGVEPEFVAIDLRGASDALGEVTGAITSDEILNRIFSEFCIGK
ncbi:MAG: tRNA uridine-5-carboxymethylaminomethyl(34) synthesis GTPase MnmE [Nitrospira sp.]|nr:tRNA uridine-5-carboxymethylaminomethyl(34) synthesis GTPase MnmE [Nitrospira sp.]